jgi:hypothetical protein
LAGLAWFAIAVTVLFALSELLGLREYTTFLSGTSANVSLGWSLTSALGLAHLLLYVGFILLAPIFLITAGLIAAWNPWKGIGQKEDDAVKEIETP